MALLIDEQDVFVIYNIPIPGEKTKEEVEEETEEAPTPPPDFGPPKEEEHVEEQTSSHGSLIQDEFETMEVRLP